MGGCGDKRLHTTSVLSVVKQLDQKFWADMARKLNQFPQFDWDWESMRKNIILPNEAHIRYHCNITDDAIWKRFCEDGYVFLNNWFELDKTSEDGELIKAPNGSRVFTSMDAEY